ncbi:MAG: hypothetical protein NVSMB32_16680 [Actinomycetota bacterium]
MCAPAARWEGIAQGRGIFSYHLIGLDRDFSRDFWRSGVKVLDRADLGLIQLNLVQVNADALPINNEAQFTRGKLAG